METAVPPGGGIVQREEVYTEMSLLIKVLDGTCAICYFWVYLVPGVSKVSEGLET